MSLQFCGVTFPRNSVHEKYYNRFIFRRVIQNIKGGVFETVYGPNNVTELLQKNGSVNLMNLLRYENSLWQC